MLPALRGPFASVDVPLCVSSTVAPCDSGQFAGNYPATGCPGLHVGNLGTTIDDSDNSPSFIDLGGGARMTFFIANGHASNGSSIVPMPPFPHEDTNEENARSLGGVISYGEFRYHFGGDLTGSGKPGEPDVESHMVAVSAPHHYAHHGADVAHLHHHARNTSSNTALINALAPLDGKSRNAVAGINALHLGSPQQGVLDGWLDNQRLALGYLWVTETTVGAGNHPRLIDANAAVILQTIQGGLGYRVQAAGTNLFSHAYPSVRGF